MRCEDVAILLPAAVDANDPVELPVQRHVQVLDTVDLEDDERRQAGDADLEEPIEPEGPRLPISHTTERPAPGGESAHEGAIAFAGVLVVGFATCFFQFSWKYEMRVPGGVSTQPLTKLRSVSSVLAVSTSLETSSAKVSNSP